MLQFSRQDGGIIFVLDSGERILVVQNRGNVLLKRGNDGGIREERLEIPLMRPLEIHPRSAERTGCTVSSQSYDQADSAIMCGFDHIIDRVKGVRIEDSPPRLEAQVAPNAVAQGL